ncbi:MAG: hypothetical protein WAV28_16735, partial [Sedimentisphaerales bacterium]
RNFIRALPVGRSFTKNAINAVTFAIHYYRSASIAETKRQVGHRKLKPVVNYAIVLTGLTA